MEEEKKHFVENKDREERKQEQDTRQQETKQKDKKISSIQAFILGIVSIFVVVALGIIFYGVGQVKKVSDSGLALQVAKTFNLLL